MEKQIKVIICADDGEWSRENTDALASRGAQVVTVNRNGTALLTKIRDEKPDVVVMDLFMAGVDALGVMHAVKAEGLPKPVFIITAAHSSNTLERQIMEAGADYYAIQPFSYTELAPGTTDWNDVYRTDPDPEHPLKRGRQLNVMLTGDEYEMLCRAAFKLGIARSAWVRERVYALLCRSYADELSPLTDASIRDNATMLLKELKTKDAGR
jgi:CheY-like chemotaxis protein